MNDNTQPTPRGGRGGLRSCQLGSDKTQASPVASLNQGERLAKARELRLAAERNAAAALTLHGSQRCALLRLAAHFSQRADAFALSVGAVR